jgi:hypothetical protein
VPSTAISRIAYDGETRTLSVWFRQSGELYRYKEVPRRVYEDFIRSTAKGRFFNRNIKDHYYFEHVGGSADGRHAA